VLYHFNDILKWGHTEKRCAAPHLYRYDPGCSIKTDDLEQIYYMYNTLLTFSVTDLFLWPE